MNTSKAIPSPDSDVNLDNIAGMLKNRCQHFRRLRLQPWMQETVQVYEYFARHCQRKAAEYVDKQAIREAVFFRVAHVSITIPNTKIKPPFGAAVKCQAIILRVSRMAVKSIG